MGENAIMITHGILLGTGSLDFLIHEIKKISDYDVVKIPREINWNKTKVYDNSNRGQKIAIYKERWV